MHTMWLGYMTELLGLPFLLPTNTPPTPHSLPEQTTAVIVPTMPPRSVSAVSTTGAGIQELKINVGNLHTKLVKAEFVGCILSGSSTVSSPVFVLMRD
jgi:ribonuclease P protein subunit POP4